MEVFEVATQLNNRDLLYDIYGYLWGLKEMAIIYDLFINNVLQQITSQQRLGLSSFEFSSPDHLPGTYEGSFIAEMQRRMHFDTVTGNGL